MGLEGICDGTSDRFTNTIFWVLILTIKALTIEPYYRSLIAPF